MEGTIWEGSLNDRYDVRVWPVTERSAVLEVVEGVTLIFSQVVSLTISHKIGIADRDIERWKQIVEDFTDEQKFSFN